MTRPTPVFLGFRVKQIQRDVGWIRAFGGHAVLVEEICGLSECMAPAPPGWEQRWDFNRGSCYNTEALAAATIPPDERSLYQLFAYRLFPLEFGKDGSKDLDLQQRLAPSLPELPAERELSTFVSLGYDIAGAPVDEWLGFNCSPLSCCGCAADFKVNEHCLIDDWDEAIRAAECFGKTEPEPGPYYIYQVLRKHNSTT